MQDSRLIQNVRLFITHSLTNSNTAVAVPLVALLHHHAKLQKSALRNLYTVLVFTLNILDIYSRDVSAGATGATAVEPKFSDSLTLSQPGGGKFCPPSQRLNLNFPRDYVPVEHNLLPWLR